ncbi:MAG TPA: hypothetical protein PLK30_25065 [Blastocatellia bacterium]|nr:hypothetical protein [Blastocatellia bacterium]
MGTRTVKQNLVSGLIAGAVALVIYSTIAAIFSGNLTTAIISVGLIYGTVTLVITFVISAIISTRKARG